MKVAPPHRLAQVDGLHAEPLQKLNTISLEHKPTDRTATIVQPLLSPPLTLAKSSEHQRLPQVDGQHAEPLSKVKQGSFVQETSRKVKPTVTIRVTESPRKTSFQHSLTGVCRM